MIKCTRCHGDMPKLRLEKYNYDFCVKCSDVKPKVGRIRVIGEGDYTVTEMDVLDQDTANKLQQMENTARGVKSVPLEILNYDEDEIIDDARALLEVTEKVINDEYEEDIVEDELDAETPDVEDLQLEDEEED